MVITLFFLRSKLIWSKRNLSTFINVEVHARSFHETRLRPEHQNYAKVNTRIESEITVQVNSLNCEVALYKIFLQLRSVEGIIN